MLNLFNSALKAAKINAFTAEQFNDNKFVDSGFKATLENLALSNDGLEALVKESTWNSKYKAGLTKISKQAKPIRLEDALELTGTKTKRRADLINKIVPSNHPHANSATKIQNYLQEMMEGAEITEGGKIIGITMDDLDGEPQTFKLPLPEIGEPDKVYTARLNTIVENIAKPPFNSGIGAQAQITTNESKEVTGIKITKTLVNGFAESINLGSISFSTPLQEPYNSDKTIKTIMNQIRKLDFTGLDLTNSEGNPINKETPKFQKKLTKSPNLIMGGVICKPVDFVKALALKAKEVQESQTIAA
ncbi:MAG: hypothetical protein ACJAZX_000308 [Rickettsiales bacterium]